MIDDPSDKIKWYDLSSMEDATNDKYGDRMTRPPSRRSITTIVTVPTLFFLPKTVRTEDNDGTTLLMSPLPVNSMWITNL